MQFQTAAMPMHPNYMRPPPYDLTYVGNSAEESLLTQEIMSCAERLGASHKEKNSAQALSARLKQKLDYLAMNPSILETLKIEDIYEVGSVKAETALMHNCIADIVIITSSLPSFELASQLAEKLVEVCDTDEFLTCVPKDYGCLACGSEANARILITVTPNIVPQLEPGLHLAEEVLRINYQAVIHSQWIEGVSGQGPLKELTRVVKDVRRRFVGLQYLNSWTVQFLCWFSMTNMQEKTIYPLGPAFRRFFQLLAAGAFLPNAPPLNDPTEPTRAIGSDLSYEQMDEVCSTAQTILRLISNKGQTMVLGVTRLGCDVTKEDTFFNGVMIRSSEPAYTKKDEEVDIRKLSVNE